MKRSINMEIDFATMYFWQQYCPWMIYAQDITRHFVNSSKHSSKLQGSSSPNNIKLHADVIQFGKKSMDILIKAPRQRKVPKRMQHMYRLEREMLTAGDARCAYRSRVSSVLVGSKHVSASAYLCTYIREFWRLRRCSHVCWYSYTNRCKISFVYPLTDFCWAETQEMHTSTRTGIAFLRYLCVAIGFSDNPLDWCI